MKNHLRTLMAIALVLVSLVTVLPSNAFAACDHRRNCYADYCYLCGNRYTGNNISHDYQWNNSSTTHMKYCTGCGSIPIRRDYHERWCTGENHCVICYDEYNGNNIRHVELITANGVSYCEWCGYYKKTETNSGNSSNTTCNHTRKCDSNRCSNCGSGYTGGNVTHDSSNRYWYYDNIKHWEFCLDCGSTLQEGEHYNICCGEGCCNVCGEYYSPLNIIHHYEGTATVCCCGEYLGTTTAPSNGGNSSNNNTNNNSYSNYQYTPPVIQFETVEFGHFEQDNNNNNGEEAIEWLVLYSDSKKALLLSRFALINMGFNKKWVEIDWDYSSVRDWLNNNFYYNAFTNEEKNVLLTSGGSSSWYGGYGEITTADSVFLLSLDEVNYYLGDAMSRRATPTPFAKANGIHVKDGFAWWWLRTMGDSNKIAQFVFENGTISTIGRDVSNYYGGVRPAIWVDASVIGLVDRVGDKEDEAHESNEFKIREDTDISEFLGSWKFVYSVSDDMERTAESSGSDNLIINLKAVDNEYIDFTFDGETIREKWELNSGVLTVFEQGIDDTVYLILDEQNHLYFIPAVYDAYAEFVKAIEETDINEYLGSWKLVYTVSGDEQVSVESFNLIMNLQAVNNEYIDLTFDEKTQRAQWQLADGMLVVGSQGGSNTLNMKIDSRNHLFMYTDTGYMEFVRED